jgi:hypothetical protein
MSDRPGRKDNNFKRRNNHSNNHNSSMNKNPRNNSGVQPLNKNDNVPAFAQVKRDVPEFKLPVMNCVLCGLEIKELASAITEQKSGEPAHFDCIVKQLQESEELQPEERICYLGNGSFGIVKNTGSINKNQLFIRKRIQYENKEVKASWRDCFMDNIRGHVS